MPSIGPLIQELHDIGFDIGAIIWVALLVLAIWRGPSYLKVILSYLNEKHRINGDLARKLKKFDLDLATKREKIGRKSGVKPKVKE